MLNDLHHILHRFEVVDGEIVGERYAFSDEAVRSVESPVYRVIQRSRFLVWLRRQCACLIQKTIPFCGKNDSGRQHIEKPFHLLWIVFFQHLSISESKAVPQSRSMISKARAVENAER